MKIEQVRMALTEEYVGLKIDPKGCIDCKSGTGIWRLSQNIVVIYTQRRYVYLYIPDQYTLPMKGQGPAIKLIRILYELGALDEEAKYIVNTRISELNTMIISNYADMFVIWLYIRAIFGDLSARYYIRFKNSEKNK